MYTKKPTSIILKAPKPNDDHMNNILEATLQIKDKNIIWDDGTDPKKSEFNKNTLGLPSPVFNRRQVVQFLLDSLRK